MTGALFLRTALRLRCIAEEDFNRFVSHVNIEFRHHLKRSMHREHRHADIYDVDIQICDIQRNRSAAAEIHPAHLADLPEHLVLVKEGADWFLRIFIDKPEGIGIEDCEAMSRAINGPLDELDPVEQSYCLEVCSPGMNRELTRDEHFAAYLGAPVQVKLIRPDEDGQRVIAGILEDYRDSTMILRMEEGDERSVARKDASSVRLMDDDFGGIEE